MGKATYGTLPLSHIEVDACQCRHSISNCAMQTYECESVSADSKVLPHAPAVREGGPAAARAAAHRLPAARSRRSWLLMSRRPALARASCCAAAALSPDATQPA